ncbi:MAG: NADH-FMN oxidoreductase RutF of DIM6/NTAB family [Candidatus Methanohalarchaeum thermophilum]|uniref:NADH-FMN oxidoreductase RutF of DIM6/NTAB family n=1 Tax=Methanohalarchaeum thermophilum TaxID=1903181 RepID=A0A1Q6DTT2_METT1|nr:MAG: NADH-FMN oxidoreductase RutF of DIM6/NTAB family [Candidatus Methanohalarchaeum thermophilum]
MTVGWSSPVSFKPPLIGVSISPERYTHEIINETGLFGVNVPTKEIAKEAYYFGTESGKNLNKFKESNLTPTKGKTGVCLVKECPAVLECEVKDAPTYGDHTFFIGEIKNAETEEDYLQENGFPDPKKGMIFWNSSGDKTDYWTFK